MYLLRVAEIAFLLRRVSCSPPSPLLSLPPLLSNETLISALAFQIAIYTYIYIYAMVYIGMYIGIVYIIYRGFI